jgi:hypothetical protein
MSGATYDISRLRSSWVSRITVERAQELVDGDCWLWTGAFSITTGGQRYGRVHVRRRFDRTVRGRCYTVEKGVCGFTHRAVYEKLVGPIPEGLQLDHLCRVTHCCNPQHLEPVTPKTNCERGMRGSQTHCLKANHPLSGDNLRTWTDPRGYEHRVCRQCNREAAARWRRERAKRQEATWAKYLGTEVAS